MRELFQQSYSAEKQIKSPDFGLFGKTEMHSFSLGKGLNLEEWKALLRSRDAAKVDDECILKMKNSDNVLLTQLIKHYLLFELGLKACALKKVEHLQILKQNTSFPNFNAYINSELMTHLLAQQSGITWNHQLHVRQPHHPESTLTTCHDQFPNLNVVRKPVILTRRIGESDKEMSKRREAMFESISMSASTVHRILKQNMVMANHKAGMYLSEFDITEVYEDVTACPNSSSLIRFDKAPWGFDWLRERFGGKERMTRHGNVDTQTDLGMWTSVKERIPEKDFNPKEEVTDMIEITPALFWMLTEGRDSVFRGLNANNARYAVYPVRSYGHISFGVVDFYKKKEFRWDNASLDYYTDKLKSDNSIEIDSLAGALPLAPALLANYGHTMYEPYRVMARDDRAVMQNCVDDNFLSCAIDAQARRMLRTSVELGGYELPIPDLEEHKEDEEIRYYTESCWFNVLIIIHLMVRFNVWDPKRIQHILVYLMKSDKDEFFKVYKLYPMFLMNCMMLETEGDRLKMAEHVWTQRVQPAEIPLYCGVWDEELNTLCKTIVTNRQCVCRRHEYLLPVDHPTRIYRAEYLGEKGNETLFKPGEFFYLDKTEINKEDQLKHRFEVEKPPKLFPETKFYPTPSNAMEAFIQRRDVENPSGYFQWPKSKGLVMETEYTRKRQEEIKFPPLTNMQLQKNKDFIDKR
jgi:hypothetical protein